MASNLPLIKNRRGISEMMSYVLIVIIVVGLFILVYAYLTLYSPKERFECTEDISLVLKDAGCSVLQAKPTCGITTTTVDFTSVLENKGNHKVSGTYLRLGAPENDVKELINTNKLFFNHVDASGKTETGLLPSTSTTFTTRYENPQSISAGILDLEIQPFVGTPEKFSICSDSVVTQRVVCSEGNVLPTVSITAPINGRSYPISDTSPSSLQFNIMATDCDGTITKVELLQRSVAQSEGSENKYTATGTGPYIVTRPLSSTEYHTGQYIYTAVAYDNKGGKGFSAPITLFYTENTPPAVTLEILNSDRDPASQVTSRDRIILRAHANDPDGTINEVQFYELFDSLGGKTSSLGTLSSGSGGVYDLELSPRATGEHKFITHAIDNLNVNTISNEATLQVTQAPLPPGAPIILLAEVIPMEDGGARGTLTIKRGNDILVSGCTTPCSTNAAVVGDILDLIATATVPAESRFSGWAGVPTCINAPPPAVGVERETTCTITVTGDLAINTAFTMVCLDSDNGDIPDTAGTTTKQPTTRTDTCSTQGSVKILTEYYCSNAQIIEKRYSCSSCTNGRCINPVQV